MGNERDGQIEDAMNGDAVIASRPSSGEEARTQVGTNILQEIRTIGIPPRPSILSEIDAEMRKDEPNFKHLASLIGADVGLAGSLIKVANSPYYGFAKKARSVPEALIAVGLKATIRAVAGLALQRVFQKVPNMERFWDSAARTARVSGWLAMRLRRSIGPLADEAYTLGLFRDCGIPVLMMPFQEYPEILRQANEEATLSFTAVEDKLLSINHALVGAELAEDWLLPEEIQQAIRCHHDLAAIEGTGPTQIATAARTLIAVCQVAEYLVTVVTGLSRTHEWEKLGATCLRVLGLDADQLAEIEREAGEVVAAEL